MATTISSPSEEQHSSPSEEQHSSPSEEQHSSPSEEQQQQTLSEKPQQPTLYDLRVPRLMNSINNGKRVPYLVLAFPFTPADQFRCAEANNFRPELTRFRRETVALDEVSELLPRHCRIDAIRYKGSGRPILGVLVASNATPRSLGLVHNIEMLQKVQRILGTNECPRWAFLVTGW